LRASGTAVGGCGGPDLPGARRAGGRAWQDPGMASPTTMITVAPTGAESLKADVPGLPVTLDELVATAKACEAAGAAMIHIHIRDAEAKPTLDLARLTDTVVAVREQTSLLVQLSTGGSVHDGYPPRLRVLTPSPTLARSPAAPSTSATTSS